MPTRAQRPQLPETSEKQKQAAKAWNGGLTGTSRKPVPTAAVQTCPVDACGLPATSRRPPAAGMVRVRGAADGASAHWYCPDRCAAIANARADLRTGGHR